MHSAQTAPVTLSKITDGRTKRAEVATGESISFLGWKFTPAFIVLPSSLPFPPTSSPAAVLPGKAGKGGGGDIIPARSIKIVAGFCQPCSPSRLGGGGGEGEEKNQDSGNMKFNTAAPNLRDETKV